METSPKCVATFAKNKREMKKKFGWKAQLSFVLLGVAFYVLITYIWDSFDGTQFNKKELIHTIIVGTGGGVFYAIFLRWYLGNKENIKEE